MATSEVFWSDPDKKRAVVWRFNGGMNWDDLDANREEIRDLQMEIPYDQKFTLIFDLRSVVQIPPFPISHMSAMRQRTPDNQDQIVVVTDEQSTVGQSIRLIADVFQTIYSYPVSVVTSMEAACDLIEKHYSGSGQARQKP